MSVDQILIAESHEDGERSRVLARQWGDGEYRKPLILGLEQAKDTIMPGVALLTRFRPFVEDELPDLVKGTLGLVAHPEASIACPRAVAGDVTLVMGPEGGFVPFEIEKLEASGCSVVHLGERILRVETALPALLARLF